MIEIGIFRDGIKNLSDIRLWGDWVGMRSDDFWVRDGLNPTIQSDGWQKIHQLEVLLRTGHRHAAQRQQSQAA